MTMRKLLHKYYDIKIFEIEIGWGKYKYRYNRLHYVDGKYFIDGGLLNLATADWCLRIEGNKIKYLTEDSQTVDVGFCFA